MLIEKEVRLKKIAERVKKSTEHYLKACEIGELQPDQTSTEDIEEAIKDIDVLNEFLYSKNLLKSVREKYLPLIDRQNKFESLIK